MPVVDTVALAPDTEAMPYVNVSPESASAPERVPVAFVKVSVATVSVKVTVEGVARVGALLRGMENVELAVLPLPALSVRALPKTEIVALPAAPTDAVNVAV